MKSFDELDNDLTEILDNWRGLSNTIEHPFDALLKWQKEFRLVIKKDEMGQTVKEQ